MPVVICSTSTLWHGRNEKVTMTMFVRPLDHNKTVSDNVASKTESEWVIECQMLERGINREIGYLMF